MKKSLLFSFFILFVGMLIFSANSVFAQTQEPEVIGLPTPQTPLDEGKRNTLGFNIIINNFGFGIGGQYSRIIGPYTEVTFSTGITGIRDVSEQSFQDFFTGQRVIPNKFNRAIGFPLTIGIKRRLFAQKIDDNFRFFVSGSAGPALAFVYPYLEDVDGNGFRSAILVGGAPRLEPINDFFSGWGDGEFEFGAAGDFKIGIDIGDNFSKLTTVEFGFFFYFFNQGLQIMEPRRPVFNNVGEIVTNPDGSIKTEPFFDEQKFFGTPQIRLLFGGMW